MLRMFILSSGKYGSRIINNIARMGMASGIVGIHEVPDNLPEFIDNVDEFVPENLRDADLILSVGLYGDINMIIPIVAAKTGAKSIIVPVHDPKQIPPGLQREIKAESGDAKIVFPRPFCTLEPVGDKYIDEFAETFGKPELEIETDKFIKNIKVKRGAPCGSTWFVADMLVNIASEDAEFEAGRLYHNYPCLASMSVDPLIGDTLMHIAGYKIKEAVKKELGFAAKSAVVDEDTCRGGDDCNYICRNECPTLKTGDGTIIIKENGKVEIDPRFCGCCGICVKKCPFEAIKIEENIKISE